MHEIEILIKRLKKINIEIVLFGNYPWVYLDSVNGNKVKEKFWSEHNYTICFLPIRKEQKFEFLDITELFKIIRKYK